MVEARSSKPLRVCDGCLALPVVLGGRTFPVSDGGALDLRSQGLGPREAAELARWVATPAGAVLTSLRCGNNPGMVGELYRHGTVRTPDAHAEVFRQLTDSLKTSQVTEIDFSSCGIGVVALGHLSDWVRDATAAIVSVNCLANHFGDEGLATLLTAIEGTSVRSLCGLTEGQTTADFSGQNLAPIDCKILAAEYDFRGFIAVLNSIMLDECWLTGTKIKNKGRWNEEIEQLDADLSGFTALCSSLGSSQIVSISLRKCYLGPEALALLTDAISSMAEVEALAVGANPIGTEGGHILTEAIKSSSLKTIDIGKPLPLQGKYESDTVDLADSGMGPGQVVILAWWITTGAAAAVESIDLSSCKLTGATFNSDYARWENIDSDMDGFIALCTVLGKVRTVRLVDCVLGARSTAELANAFRD
eukprot:COSAG06_NODE_2659_length_6481_cov_7.712943_6_plen_418_part_01